MSKDKHTTSAMTESKKIAKTSKDIEIPLEKDRHARYRFYEMLPGMLSWSMLALPFLLSWINATVAAAFMFMYILINFLRATAAAVRSIQGHKVMREHQKLDWTGMLTELESGQINGEAVSGTGELKYHKQLPHPKWHYEFMQKYQARQADAHRAEDNPHIVPSEIIHAIIIATYKESREILEPTIKSVLAGNYDMKKVIFILAYEQRGGDDVAKRANDLVDEYGPQFMHAMAVAHPSDIPNEVVGKGGNVTYAGRQLQKYLDKEKIDPLRVLVTTLDADNRPDKLYLPALSYVYSVCPDPVHASFQPVSMYTNNIWDAPAPMRVVATGNSIFNIVISLRQHALRNFSSHAQPMAGLIQTDFWSVRTIVEDGHQFWRSYFTFDGNYRVYPLYVPICQDAVLTEKYVKTLKAQFVQLRRWTWGASDIAYMVDQGMFKPGRFKKLPKFDYFAKLWRLTEGHVTWAVGPILVLLGGFVPNWFYSRDIVASQLPIIVSKIQTVALLFAFVTIYFAFVTLPPKPARYKRHRTLWMIAQWVYLPLTTIGYNSLAALNSQTRLIFKRYITKFDVTEKAVVTADNVTIAEQKHTR